MKLVWLSLFTIFTVTTPVYGQEATEAPRMDRIKEMISDRQVDRSQGDNSVTTRVPAGLGAGKVIQGLALILGVFFVGVYAYQKYSGKTVKNAGGRRIRILDRAPLSAKSSLVLARVDNREVLLAVGGDNVTFCRELIVDEIDQEMEQVCDQEDGGTSSL